MVYTSWNMYFVGSKVFADHGQDKNGYGQSENFPSCIELERLLQFRLMSREPER